MSEKKGRIPSVLESGYWALAAVLGTGGLVAMGILVAHGLVEHFANK